MQLILLGEVPWVALLLALSFGTYGLLRKQVTLDGLSGLFVETLLLFPLGAAALAWLYLSGSSHFLDDGHQSVLLITTGAVTAIPLMLFAGAARRLRLAPAAASRDGRVSDVHQPDDAVRDRVARVSRTAVGGPAFRFRTDLGRARALQLVSMAIARLNGSRIFLIQLWRCFRAGRAGRIARPISGLNRDR